MTSQRWVLGIVIAIACVACSGPGSTKPAPNQPAAVANDITIQQQRKGTWLVRATRKLGTHQATGSAVTSQAPSNSDRAPHSVLAAARAWADLADSRRKMREFKNAIEAAHAGLAELGKQYRIRGLRDDTGLRIHHADYYIAKGDHENPSASLIDILRIRIRLYIRRHAGAAK